MVIVFPHLSCKFQNMKTGSGAIRDIDQPPAIEVHIVRLNYLVGSTPLSALPPRSWNIMTHLSGLRGIRNIDDS
jgi:hypothetical protein